MHAITGITGKVGSELARTLLAEFENGGRDALKGETTASAVIAELVAHAARARTSV